MIQSLAVVAAITALAAPSAPATPEALVQVQLDAYNAHNLDAFVACYAQNVEFWTMDGKVNPEKGAAAMRKGYAELFAQFPKVKVKVLRRISQGAYVIDQQEADGMGPNPVTYTAIYWISQGKIARVWYIQG